MVRAKEPIQILAHRLVTVMLPKGRLTIECYDCGTVHFSPATQRDVLPGDRFECGLCGAVLVVPPVPDDPMPLTGLPRCPLQLM